MRHSSYARAVAVGVMFIAIATGAGTQQRWGFVNRSVNQMDATHWYIGGESLLPPSGRWPRNITIDQEVLPIPLPAGTIVKRFQGTASWRTIPGCSGPLMMALVDRNPANYNQPPLIYPIILKTQRGEAANIWFDYSVPLTTIDDQTRIEAYGIPEGRACGGDFEIQAVLETQ